MGISNGDFVKYPRTPHLFGSVGTSDDKHLNQIRSLDLLADASLIVEEKIDGTNVGIHFSDDGQMHLQCRGHLITEGMHPQYDLFKQWAATKRIALEPVLQNRYIVFGEWVYAMHSINYLGLPHYFFEFDIFDKAQNQFLDLGQRQPMIDLMAVQTVPVLHRGPIDREQLMELIGPSEFDSTFDNPVTNQRDNLMEGLYLRTEANGVVASRAKIVRPEFVEKIKQSTHWQHRKIVPNQLAEGVDVWR